LKCLFIIIIIVIIKSTNSEYAYVGELCGDRSGEQLSLGGVTIRGGSDAEHSTPSLSAGN